ncbi:hypothetical protein SLEP1_g45834 [Rubroshorea leprosula]|uniref:Uncharacterized protein n=1 Tax=Rubroshorea leprosula TaxID=152421 RepID=A0AAV5LL02_9ROSI|nr:hypothetical protein SLEP1_g45834 [Rubroshorea leprosula]
MGEKRDVGVDCEEDEGFKPVLPHLRHPLRLRSRSCWLRCCAAHQLPQLATRGSTPPERPPRLSRKDPHPY